MVKTVSVFSKFATPIKLQLQELREALDGSGAKQAHPIGQPITIVPGHNAVVDHGFMTKWWEQHAESDLVKNGVVTMTDNAEDEDPVDAAARASATADAEAAQANAPQADPMAAGSLANQATQLDQGAAIADQQQADADADADARAELDARAKEEAAAGQSQ